MAATQFNRTPVPKRPLVKRSNESLPWFLFGAGGFIVAFFLPVHIFLFGIAIPLGWVASPGQHSLLLLIENPVTQIYLGVLCIFGFLHAGHRLRSTSIDSFRAKHLEYALGFVFYGAAIAASIITIILLVTIP
ncbi:MAG: fumarate reductase subunit FrdD [Candidatus Binataceae bacterium]